MFNHKNIRLFFIFSTALLGYLLFLNWQQDYPSQPQEVTGPASAPLRRAAGSRIGQYRSVPPGRSQIGGVQRPRHDEPYGAVRARPCMYSRRSRSRTPPYARISPIAGVREEEALSVTPTTTVSHSSSQASSPWPLRSMMVALGNLFFEIFY